MTSRGPRIAIIKLSALGDVVHTLPVARALRRALPSSHLTWVVEAREYAVLRDHPDLDAVVPVDTRLWRSLIWRLSGARQNYCCRSCRSGSSDRSRCSTRQAGWPDW